LLSGVPLPDQEAAEINARLPLAVMVDNAPGAARPQYGLDHADLVYELLVESGITRYLAVYHQHDAALIEPVRSVRTPFLYIVSEVDAVLAHVGASETEGEADSRWQMGEWGIRHLEEREHWAPFRRDRARLAPHNVVTSTSALREEAAEQGWYGPPAVEPWLFKDDLLLYNPTAGVTGHISLGFGTDPMDFARVDWYYDPNINGYRRYLAGRPHVDARSGATLSARNVIVQFDDAWLADHEGHVLYGSTGEGPALIFSDSQVMEAVWRKPSREARTRYVDPEGAEIRFNRGATWIAMLPHGSPVTWD
jgi:hypothetical protein